MIASLVISITTCVAIILTSIFKPSIKIKNHTINLYWAIALLGAILILATVTITPSELWQGLTAENGINPFQILILFLSMSIISIFLDEVGFFEYLASVIIKRCKKTQYIVFIAFYLIASVLTMFTSNDIVILTLTPFIIFFCKNGKINPLPYLVSEFIAANTWSMMFIIGNPTNIYLGTTFNIDFISYLKVMWLPTLGAGIIEFCLLLLIFHKQLAKEMEQVDIVIPSYNKLYTIVGLIILVTCIIFLIISSYIKIAMYLISAIALGCLVVAIILICLLKRKAPVELGKALLRSPWEIIPFVLAMFVLVLSLTKYDVTKNIANFLGSTNSIYTYGYSSLLMANLLNNIPMSVLYSSILTNVSPNAIMGATYASIIASNIGAFITPIGALAGIMWMGILKTHDIKYSFLDFSKYGLLIGGVTVTVAFLLLNVTIYL